LDKALNILSIQQEPRLASDACAARQMYLYYRQKLPILRKLTVYPKFIWQYLANPVNELSILNKERDAGYATIATI